MYDHDATSGLFLSSVWKKVIMMPTAELEILPKYSCADAFWTKSSSSNKGESGALTYLKNKTVTDNSAWYEIQIQKKSMLAFPST